MLSTVPESAADELAAALLDERLVACVQVTAPVVSHFDWNGERQRASERLLIMKTTATVLESLRMRLTELHPYDVPEILEFEAASGLGAYTAWVNAHCG